VSIVWQSTTSLGRLFQCLEPAAWNVRSPIVEGLTLRYLGSVIDAKFHKNPLFCLLDFKFFQTAVTNLSYRYDSLPCWRHLWLLQLSPSSRRVPQSTVPWDSCATASWDTQLHQLTGFTTKQSISHSPPDLDPVDYGMRFGAFCTNNWLKSGDVLIRTLLTEQWISGVIEHLIRRFWLLWLTSTVLETHNLLFMLFKNSYFSKVKADFYAIM